MNVKSPSSVLDDISQNCVPEDVNLLPGILAKIQKGKGSTMKPKNKVILTILSTMVVLVTLLYAIPAGVSAMRKLLGFIPGIGIVDQTTELRVLANPVTDTRDGFHITVENAVLDSEHTVISFKIEGPFETQTNQSNNSELSDICFKNAELHLPDGTILQVPDGLPQSTWPSGYRSQNTYTAIPIDVNQAVLFLPCLHASLPGQNPENWEIPLSFVAAPPEMTVYPISGQTTSTEEVTPANTEFQTPYGISLELGSVIPLSDGQLLQTRVVWRDDPRIIHVTLYPEDIKILDANEQEVSFSPSSDAIDPNENSNQSVLYGYKIASITTAGPAKLVVNSAAEVTYGSSVTFTFDPGPNPKLKQKWELNKELILDGRRLRINNITLNGLNGKNVSLSFEMESPDGIFYANIIDKSQKILSGGGGGGDQGGSFFTSFNYESGLPEGPITFSVVNYSVRLDGPWTLEWTPVESKSTNTDPIIQPQEVCLNEPAWKEAMANPQPIPAELNYKVLVEEHDSGTKTSRLSLARLDGSEVTPIIENAYNASVSPDGTQVLYENEKGLFVQNISTGVNQPIPGTSSNTNIFTPFWSPDGKQIGYSGTLEDTAPNIFLAKLDGSTPTAITNDEPLKIMQGWMPDGNILYVAASENAPTLKLLDPQSGKTSSLFTVPQLATMVVPSRDGKHQAIIWSNGPGAKQPLYVFTANGSQRRTILELNEDGNISKMLWSPDGKWLLVEMSWNLTQPEPYTKALIQVDTCQIVPISNLKGSVSDWLP